MAFAGSEPGAGAKMIIDIKIETGSVTPLEIDDHELDNYIGYHVAHGEDYENAKRNAIQVLVDSQVDKITYTWKERSQ